MTPRRVSIEVNAEYASISCVLRDRFAHVRWGVRLHCAGGGHMKQVGDNKHH